MTDSPTRLTQHLLLNPAVVLRYGGLPTQLGTFPAGAATAALQQADAAAISLTQQAATLCTHIEARIPDIYDHDPVAAMALIRIKRRIHNGRIPPAVDQEAIAHLAEFADAIGEVCTAIEATADLEAAYQAHYLLEIATGETHALSTACTAALHHALSITAPAVEARLRQWRSDPKCLSSKQRSALAATCARYLLRASHKTSPLSTMGIVGVGQWVDPRSSADGNSCVQQQVGHVIVPDTVEHRRAPRLAILDRLGNHILSRRELLRSDTLIEPNSSLVIDKGAFAWLSRTPSTSANGNQYRRNRSTAAFIRLLLRIREAQPEPITLAALRAILMDQANLSLERADKVLEQAWTSQIIRPVLPYGDTQAWFAAVLELCTGDVGNRLRGHFARITECLRMPVAAASQEIEDGFRAMAALVDADLPIALLQPAIVEDCVMPRDSLHVSRAAWTSFAQDFARVAKLGRVLAFNAPMTLLRHWLIDAFVERYGSGGECTEVGQFVFEHGDRLERMLDGPTEQINAYIVAMREAGPVLPQLLRLRIDCLNMIAERCDSDGGEITLPEALFDAIIEQADELAPAPASHMLFAQPLPLEPNPTLVINQIYPGASATFSRFLSAGDPLCEPIAAYLDRLSPAGRMVEILDDNAFNAAAHPPLANEQIEVPPSAPWRSSGVNFADIRLRHVAARNDVEFVDADDRALSIVYTAIMTPLLMERQQQIVRALGANFEICDDVVQSLLPYLSTTKGQGIVRCPRIRWGNVILTRKAWGVPRDRMPPLDSPAMAFFRAMQALREQLELPRHIFCQRVAQLSWPDQASRDAQSPRMNKIGKPLPVDLESPLTVRLMQKELAAHAHHPLLIEALPQPDDGFVEVNGVSHCGEWGIEVSVVEAVQPQ